MGGSHAAERTRRAHHRKPRARMVGLQSVTQLQLEDDTIGQWVHEDLLVCQECQWAGPRRRRRP